MDIVGIDISKPKFDAARLLGERLRHAAFYNTEAGFERLLAWLAKHRPDPAAPMHACMEATGNWGLEHANFLHAQQGRVSIGRSGGGLSTKIHTLGDGVGNPIGFSRPRARHTISSEPAISCPKTDDKLIADKAYDADERVISVLADAEKTTVVPSKVNRGWPEPMTETFMKNAI